MITLFTMVLLLSVPFVTAWASLQPAAIAFKLATVAGSYTSGSTHTSFLDRSGADQPASPPSAERRSLL